MHQSHHVLQLVAKAEGAARLVERGACPQPAGQYLVQQPAVGQNVHRAVWCLDLHGAQRVRPVLLHVGQRSVGCGRAAPALHQVARFFGCCAAAQAKNNFIRLPWGQHTRDAQGSARVQRRPHAAAQLGLRHRGRLSHAAMQPQKRTPVTTCATGCIRGPVDVIESSAAREIRVVGVAGQHCAAVRVPLGYHMHGGLAALVAQHPLDIAGDRQASLPVRVVAQFEQRELDWRVLGDKHRQFGRDAALLVFKHAVAKAVAHHISGAWEGAGQQGGRPVVAAVFVAQVKRFGVGVADRVVRPGGQPEQLRVFAPGVGAAALGDESAKRRIHQDVDPRNWRHPFWRDRGDVLMPVRAKAPQAIGKLQFTQRAGMRGLVWRLCWQGGQEAVRLNGFFGAVLRQLLGQQAVAALQLNACHSLKKHHVCIWHLALRAHKNTDRLVCTGRVSLRCDQCRDLRQQSGLFQLRLGYQHHQIHFQSRQTPVGMRPHQLVQQLQMCRITEMHQHDGPITRDGVTPKSRLALLVAGNDLRVGAQRCIGIQDGGGEGGVALHVVGAGVQLG